VPSRLSNGRLPDLLGRIMRARVQVSSPTVPVMTTYSPDSMVCRPLSPLERWHWVADRISPLHVIARARVYGALPIPLLRRALDELQDRHPLLSVAIRADDADMEPWFVPRPVPIPLRSRNLDTGGSAHLACWWEVEVNERELCEPIDVSRGPLARAVILTRVAASGTGEDVHDLLLTLSHCIADGTTALALLEEWIRLAARRAGAGPHSVVDPGPARWPVRPEAEAMFPRRHQGLPGAMSAMTRQLRDQASWPRRQARRLAPSTPVPAEQRRTRLLHRSLSQAQFSALMRVCDREDTTVHGALAAAMIAAVAQETGVAGPGRYVIGSPVDFRADLEPPVSRREAGSYVATLRSYPLYRPGEPLWPTAREVSRDLARRRRNGGHFAVVNLLGLMGPESAATSGPSVRRLESRELGDLRLSNIGRYDFPDRIGEWRVDGAQFVAGVSVSGYFVATVNTSHHQLHWNFTYAEGVLSRKRAQGLVTACVEGLLSAVWGPSQGWPVSSHALGAH